MGSDDFEKGANLMPKSSSVSERDYAIIVNGQPGKMAKIIAQAVLPLWRDTSSGRKIGLLGASMTGQGMGASYSLEPKNAGFKCFKITLVPPEEHDSFLKEMKEQRPNEQIIAIDFVKGDGQADRNAQLYFENKIPFVMGSTGADYEAMDKLAREAGIPCLGFPNMDMRLGAWMYGVQQMAERFPGAFEGATVKIWESHQAGKADTSGTAKAMLNQFGELSRTELTIDDIAVIRDPKFQEAVLGVPKDFLGWHAYHNIEVRDNDGNSERLAFKRHGGASYARGTLKALDFLIDVIENKGEAKRYTMFDTFL